jgi:hypothetical protein
MSRPSTRTAALLALIVSACGAVPKTAPRDAAAERTSPCGAVIDRELGPCLAAAAICKSSDLPTCARAALTLDGSGERHFPEGCHRDIIRALSRGERQDAGTLLDLIARGSAETRTVTYRALADSLSAGLVEEIAASGHPAAGRALVVAGYGIARDWAQKKLSERPDAEAATAAVNAESWGKGVRERYYPLPTPPPRSPPRNPVDIAREDLDSADWSKIMDGARATMKLGTTAAALRPHLEARRDHWSAAVRGCVAAALKGLSGVGAPPWACERWRVDHGLACDDALRSKRWRFRRNGVVRTEVARRWHGVTSEAVPDVAYEPRDASVFICLDVRSRPVVKVEGGWLGGYRESEWHNGGLLFIRPSGEVERVGGAADALYLTRSGVPMVVTGSIDMDGNDRGWVQRVDRDGGSYRGRYLATLPGAPDWSMLDDDDAIVTGSRAGVAAVHPDGRMEVIRCE